MRDERQIARIIASDFGANATYVEDLLRQFRNNPASVGEEWEGYFTELTGEGGGRSAELPGMAAFAQQPVGADLGDVER